MFVVITLTVALKSENCQQTIFKSNWKVRNASVMFGVCLCRHLVENASLIEFDEVVVEQQLKHELFSSGLQLKMVLNNHESVESFFLTINQ